MAQASAPENFVVDVSDSDDDEEPPLLVSLGDDPATEPAPPAADQLNEETLPPCPVTILSGFLGSGKTTLIQHILHSPDHGRRIAVIENEFGDGLAIESLIAKDGIVSGSNGDDKEQPSALLADLIELPNGCVCCTVKDSLVITLETLLEKRRDLDYILLECSGMANPGPLASLLWLDEALQSRLRLDGIVTLVDAAHIERQLSETEEAAQQIAYADRILLNKVDLIQGNQHHATCTASTAANGNGETKTDTATATTSVDSILSLIRNIHPTAPIQPTTYSTVPHLDWILDAKCFDGDRFQEKELVEHLSTNTHNESSADDHHDHSHDHHHHHDNDLPCPQCTTKDQHQHTTGVSTVSLVESGTVDWKRLNAWLAQILWPNQDEKDSVLRVQLAQELETADASSTSIPNRTSNNNSTSQIFRVKGILSVRHEGQPDYNSDDDDDATPSSSIHQDEETGIDSRRFIVQAVYDTWEIHAASLDLAWTVEEDRCCKLVVIGRNLHKEELEQEFRDCLIECS